MRSKTLGARLLRNYFATGDSLKLPIPIPISIPMS